MTGRVINQPLPDTQKYAGHRARFDQELGGAATWDLGIFRAAEDALDDVPPTAEESAAHAKAYRAELNRVMRAERDDFHYSRSQGEDERGDLRRELQAERYGR